MHQATRRLVIVLFASLVASFSIVNAVASEASRSTKAPAEPPKGVTEFLLSTAAAEFKTSSPLRIAALRQVRVGYFSDVGPGRYVLCGRVRPADSRKTGWIQFATVQTSPYEQWLGGVAESICTSKKIKLYPKDLSSELLKRVQS